MEANEILKLVEESAFWKDLQSPIVYINLLTLRKNIEQYLLKKDNEDSPYFLTGGALKITEKKRKKY